MSMIGKNLSGYAKKYYNCDKEYYNKKFIKKSLFALTK